VSETPPLLGIRRVSKLFHVAGAMVQAVDRVSLDLARGRTLAIVGESGSGKSTLAHMILGIEAPSAGELFMDGKSLPVHRDRALRRRIGFVQQNPYSALNPRKSVRQAIELPLIVHGLATGRERRRKVDELLERVGLQRGFAERRPAALSGGQRQRVVIARALATSPDLLVLDEPTSSLDVSVQARILALLRGLQRDLGLTYLFITHDLGVVRVMADEVAVMYRGRVVERAPVTFLFSAPRHRYTNLLLASIPTASEEDDAVKPEWSWDVAAQDAPAADSGCAFRLRCPFAVARCAAEAPELVADGPGHWHACFVPARARVAQPV
jgi:peptide/nickel transport system ATP-binding protein/oligopeptide transport system ATP-binding protein